MKLKRLFPGFRLPSEMRHANVAMTWTSLERDLQLVRVASSALQREPRYFDASRAASGVLAAAHADTSRLLNFELCIGPMNLAAWQKRLATVWEFAMQSLLHRPPGTKVVEADFLAPFMEVISATDSVESLWQSVAEWTMPFFWLLRNSDAALDVVGKDVDPFATMACLRHIATMEGAVGACSLLDWYAVREPEALSRHVLALTVARGRDDTRLPMEVRTVFAVAMASRIGERAGIDVRQAAYVALADFGEYLRWHEGPQMLAMAASANVATAMAALPDLRIAIDRYSAMFEGDAVARRLDRSMLFDILMPLIALAVRDRNPVLLVAVVSSWLGDTGDRPLVVCLPSMEFGTVWASPGSSMAMSVSAYSLAEIVQLSNRVLGRRTAVSNAAEFLLDCEPSTVGVPNNDGAVQWLERLRSFYFGGLEMERDMRVDLGMVVARHLGHPVQAVMVAELGWTLPLASSNERPLPLNKSKRCIFFRASDVLGAEIEQAVVVALFEAEGWEVEEVSGLDASRERFLEAYQSDDYSVVWLSGHGEVDSFEPDVGYLCFGEQRLSVRDLSSPKHVTRRVLVLNTCDSSTGVVMGGLAEFSFAAFACGVSQSVIGHLWPTEWRAAVLLGAVLARLLAKAVAPFQAFECALSLGLRGPEGIAAELLPHIPATRVDDFMAITRGAKNVWSPVSWASLTYHE